MGRKKRTWRFLYMIHGEEMGEEEEEEECKKDKNK